MVLGIPVWIIVIGVIFVAVIVIAVVRANVPDNQISPHKGDGHHVWTNAPHRRIGGKHRKPPEVK